jgi:predicted flap endonuclease-1-like 5' DNA nuclease
MCFLIPLLTGMASALLGYLLGKMVSGGNQINLKSKLDASLAENEKLNYELYLLQKNSSSDTNLDSNQLQTELEKCKSHSAQLQVEIDTLKAKSTSSHSEPEVPFDADLVFSVFGKKIKKDDLKIVEGIGPKIEGLYHNADIKTWKQLANTPKKISREILDEAGTRYGTHNPETWSKQAQLAYLGKWRELKDYQDSLNAGKE